MSGFFLSLFYLSFFFFFFFLEFEEACVAQLSMAKLCVQQ